MKNPKEEFVLGIAEELLQESIQERQTLTLESDGFSMHPLISQGDKITFKKKANFKFLDILLFRAGTTLCGHRFIRKIKIDNKVFLMLKADARWRFDKPVSIDSVLGVVTEIRKGKRIIKLDTPRGKWINSLSIIIAYLNLIRKINFLFSAKINFKNELEFLTLLMQDNLGYEQLALLKGKLSNGLNWGYLTEKIKWNFISPLFIERFFKDLGWQDLVPRDIWQKIDNQRRFGLVSDTQNRALMEQVLIAFNKLTIKPLLTKGSQLGLEVYGESYQRWMGDLDILVKSEDWSKACVALKTLGLKASDDVEYLDDWALSHLDNHIDFSKNGVRVELKSNIWAIDFPYFDNRLWQRIRGARLGLNEAYFPSYEDTLLIACINLLRHNFSGLIWFYDIKKILERFTVLINWKKFVSLAREHDLTVTVYYALFFTDKLLNAKIPDGLLSEIRPTFLQRGLFSFYWDKEAILLKKESATNRAKIPFEYAFMVFAGKLNLNPRKTIVYCRYLLSLIFPPLQHMRSKYKIDRHSVLWFKFYLIRFMKFTFVLLNSVGSVVFRIKNR